MWNAVELDAIPGRVRAVSAPDRRQMLVVWTTDGLYGVWFARAATVLRMGSPAEAGRAFDPARGVLTWKGAAFRMHGECGAPGVRYGGDLRREAPNGDRLVFDDAGRLTAVECVGGLRKLLGDPPRPDRWFVAGFSEDGRYLLVADEWGVRLWRYSPARGSERARWARGGASVEQQALLRAVVANPDDDTPRLVYADWLGENGDPDRGEFIRLQCRFARCVRAGDLFADEGRMQELLAGHGERWSAELPVIRGVKWTGFWRGFPGLTAVSPGALARAAEKVWAAAPVESVVLGEVDDAGAAALVRCPYLDRFRVLEFRGLRLRGGVRPMRALLAAPALAGLWWLAFRPGSRWRGGPDLAEVIAASEPLRNLEVLTMPWCDIMDTGAERLIASPHLTKLRGLDLTGNEFTGDTPSRLRKRFPAVRF